MAKKTNASTSKDLKKSKKTKNPKEPKEPDGELVIQNLAMPANANVYGDIFGGWLVSEMDLGGAVLALRRAQNRVTTVAIDNISFLKPVYVGDLICCYAKVLKTGRSSITIKVQVWVIRMRIGAKEPVTEGIFTYVAINEKGRPKQIKW